jgi:alkylation response protein AidB-like acyl-CoA dehydrogenase
MTASVRDEVRAFLDVEYDESRSLTDWLNALVDAGWAVPTWPVEWFGRGLSSDQAASAYEEFARVGAPGPPAGLAVMLAAPTIIAHGTQEQKQRFVRSVLVGDNAWCQLFSEPAAGSDLASLKTRAALDGDEYVVNGQKVWTSGAQGADFGMLLARTDVDAPKHRGITYFALPMDQLGVEVRPLRQMTGDAIFAEVFFTDARVPVANVIGEVNGGWSVALTTLANERVGLGAGASLSFPLSAPGGSRLAKQRDCTIAELKERARAVTNVRPASAGASAMIGAGARPLARLARESTRDGDPEVRQRLARLHTLMQLNRWNGLRGRAAAKAGGRPGPEASLGKLMASNISRQWRETAAEIVGPQAMLAGPDSPLGGTVAHQLLAAPGPAIYGGSDQIQRNIIGERVLGLPREPDVSKSVPFRELAVGTLSGGEGAPGRGDGGSAS